MPLNALNKSLLYFKGFIQRVLRKLMLFLSTNPLCSPFICIYCHICESNLSNVSMSFVVVDSGLTLNTVLAKSLHAIVKQNTVA